MPDYRVIYFDIGDTLASAMFVGTQLTLTPLEGVSEVLDDLAKKRGIKLGIISNSHAGTEPADERERLTRETLRALEACGLLPFFQPELILLSSATGLRKDSPVAFEHAAGRAGVARGACLFVGENRNERRFAARAGMEACPHPRLVSAMLDGQAVAYVQVQAATAEQSTNLFARLSDSAFLFLTFTENQRGAIGIGTARMVEEWNGLGFQAEVLADQPDPRFSDLYILRDFIEGRDRGQFRDGGARLSRVDERHRLLGLSSGQSIDSFHVGHGHGHTTQLKPRRMFQRRVAAARADSGPPPRTALTDAELSEITRLITADAMQAVVDRYSGRNPAVTAVTRNRHVRSPDMARVLNALVEDFTRIGGGRLIVKRHRFMMDDLLELDNIIAELPGLSPQIVMISAHLDSTSQGTYGTGYDPLRHDAPGADDDASGMAGVLSAARVFCSRYADGPPPRTVQFVLFNAEEQRLIGSENYALARRAAGDDILAVFQLDMIGYNSREPNTFEIHSGHSNAEVQERSRRPAETATAVAHQMRRLGLIDLELPQLFPEPDGQGGWKPDPGADRSDHARFQDVGYAACITSGDFFPSHQLPADGNPNYHKITDVVANFPYAADIARVICGAALCWVGPEAPPPARAREARAAKQQVRGRIATAETGRIRAVRPRPHDVPWLLADAAVESGAFLFDWPADLEPGPVRFEWHDADGRQVGRTVTLPLAANDLSIVLSAEPAAASPARGRAAARTARGQVALDEILDAARAIVRPRAARVAGGRELRLEEEDEGGRRTLCQTDRLEQLKILARESGLPNPEAIDLEIDRVLLTGGRESFAAQEYNTSHFSIAYQTTGADAVNPSTAAADIFDPGRTPAVVRGQLPDDPGGVPTYVRRVAFWLEEALRVYTQPPFSLRNPAARRRIPASILDVDFGAASPSGFVINKELPNDLVCAVTVHELFHMIQYEYGGTGLWRDAMMEGGATFAEDALADLMNRYLDEAGHNFNGRGLLVQPNQNLPLRPTRYKTSLLWRYIAEQRSRSTFEPGVGSDSYRRLIETCSTGTYSTADIASAVRAMPGDTEFHTFVWLNDERRDLRSSETTLGNFALACYLKQLGANVPDRRFDFLEDDEPIFIGHVVPGAPVTPKLVSVTIRSRQTVAAAGIAVTGRVNPFGSEFHEVVIDPSVANVRLRATGSEPAGLLQVVSLDRANRVRDIFRFDRLTCDRTLDARELGLLMVVVTAADEANDYGLSVEPATPTPNVMITRWNSRPGQEYHADPNDGAWTWVSPDLWFEPAATAGTFTVSIRLRNKGGATATGIQTTLEYVVGPVPADGWMPVADAAGTPQKLTGAALAAGAESVWSFPWSPAAASPDTVYTLRARITAPNDPNTDNKSALSTLGFAPIRDSGGTMNVPPSPRGGDVQLIPRLPGGWTALTPNRTGPTVIRLEIRTKTAAARTADRPELLPRSLAELPAMTFRYPAGETASSGATVFLHPQAPLTRSEASISSVRRL